MYASSVLGSVRVVLDLLACAALPEIPMDGAFDMSEKLGIPVDGRYGMGGPFLSCYRKLR